MKDIELRIRRYWAARAKDFGIVRKNELNDDISRRWLSEILCRLPKDKKLKILDVGTGTGYFAILLAKQGHSVTGIDISRVMLAEARCQCRSFGVSAEFLEMDAQVLTFSDSAYDVVISRNLIWTLPEPLKAYREWIRVLKPGGILLNFDADYASNVRHQNQRESYIKPDDFYGHWGITEELERENAEITLAMPASRQKRPEWDMEVLRESGLKNVSFDRAVGQKILLDHDLSDAPMFLVTGIK